MAETAATGTAAHDLHRDAVMHHIDRWDDEAGGRRWEFCHNSLDHFGWGCGVKRSNHPDRAVRVVLRLIECGDVHAGNPGQRAEKFLATSACAFPGLVGADDVVDQFLALAYGEGRSEEHTSEL